MQFSQLIQRTISKVGYAFGMGLVRNTPTLRRELEYRAIMSSADYVQKNMRDAVIFLTHQEILEFSYERRKVAGPLLEFGVYKGNTINFLATLCKKNSDPAKLYGFDSFEGLPNDWAGYIITKETFDLKGYMPRVEGNVKLIKGFFDQTLPDFIAANGSDFDQVSLLHIDSDLYSSCKVVLQELKNHIKTGSFILFDEYFNYPNWQEHEYKAFQEFIDAEKLNYKYLGIYEQKVLVEIL